jgi:hypothetical protein
MTARQMMLPANRAFNNNGLAVPGATAELYLSGGLVPANFYADAGLSVSLGPTLTANGAGRFPTAYQDDATAFRLITRDDQGGDLDDTDPYYFGTMWIGSALVQPVIQTTSASSVADYWNANALASSAKVTVRFQNGLEVDGTTRANIAGIYVGCNTSNPATTEGYIVFQTRLLGSTGTLTDRMILDGAGLTLRPITDNNLDLGTTSMRWKNAYCYILNATTLILCAGGIGTTSPTVGIGYATGAGGTVAQGTSKSTGVTLNKNSGAITMNNAALASAAKVSFVITNSSVAATDVVVVNVASGGTANAYRASVTAVAAGSFTVTVENITGGSLSESPVVSFALLKGVTS